MQLEIQLFHLINSLSGKSALIDRFMISMSDSFTWVVVALVTLSVLLRTKNTIYLSVFFAALIALGFADLISFEIIKPLVGRERPCWIIPGVITILGKCGGSYGFTSNHAANAFAVWAVFARSMKPLSWQSQFLLSVASIVSLSRVYLGVHFVGDIVGGAVLGSAIGWSLCSLNLKCLTDKWAQKFVSWY